MSWKFNCGPFKSVLGDNNSWRKTVVHANLDFADRRSCPQSCGAIRGESRATAEVDIIVFRLRRPVLAQIEFDTKTYSPAGPIAARAEAKGLNVRLVAAEVVK